MAKIYRAPDGFEAPEFEDFVDIPGAFVPHGPYDQAMEKFETELAEYARQYNDSPLVGKVIRFGVADGKASYMIWSTRHGLELVWIPGPDAYQLPEPYARGLRVSDARDMVRADEAWAKMTAANSGS